MRALRTTAVSRLVAVAAILAIPALTALLAASAMSPAGPAHRAAPPPPTVPTVRVPMVLISDQVIADGAAASRIVAEHQAVDAYLAALHDRDTYLAVVAYLHALHDADVARQAAHVAVWTSRATPWRSRPYAAAAGPPSPAGSCYGITDPNALYVISKESGCRTNAVNPTSGDCGIGQLATREACGADGYAQADAMTRYVMSRYGSWAAAAAHERAYGWY